MGHHEGLYRADQVRELDRLAIEVHGIEGYELMSRAGQAVFAVIRARFPEAGSLTVACGAGNNGGDGYVIARLARQAGIEVSVIAMTAPEKLGGDARQAADDWLESGGEVTGPDGEIAGDLVVDALLGTGLDREVRGDYAAIIERIEQSGRPVVAVDVPSGINSDTGGMMGRAVRADVTVSFVGRKRGLYTGAAVDHVGDRVFDRLGVPDAVYDRIEPDARLLAAERLWDWLPPRKPSAHKGQLGHVLIAGSDQGMPGAVLLAARAALETGSGLVSVATRAAHASALAASLPEAMWAGVETLEDLDQLLARADVIALGPGLGQSEWSRAIWKKLLDMGKPVILDADGLNLLAGNPRTRGGWILTPHPGEAARLLECSVSEIQSDRFAAARELAERYRAVCVLKGAGTLVADPAGRLAVCPHGNPAMATAGMGDALTGIIVSLLGQGLEGFDAAACGVLLHALAGDRAARGRRQILVSDLIGALRDVLPA